VKFYLTSDNLQKGCYGSPTLASTSAPVPSHDTPSGQTAVRFPGVPPGHQSIPVSTSRRPWLLGASARLFAISNHRPPYKGLAGSRLGARTFHEILVVKYTLYQRPQQCLLCSSCQRTFFWTIELSEFLPHFCLVTVTHPHSPSHPSRLPDLTRCRVRAFPPGCTFHVVYSVVAKDFVFPLNRPLGSNCEQTPPPLAAHLGQPKTAP